MIVCERTVTPVVEDRPVSSVSRRGRSQPSCCTRVEGNFCVDVMVINTYLWRRAGEERPASVCGQWGGSGTGEGAWGKEEGRGDRKEGGGGSRYEVLVAVDILVGSTSIRTLNEGC